MKIKITGKTTPTTNRNKLKIKKKHIDGLTKLVKFISTLMYDSGLVKIQIQLKNNIQL